jgi:ectoine hydroxylase-related dioxygenase (phytanoyl-CoA dioxygenase family)
MPGSLSTIQQNFESQGFAGPIDVLTLEEARSALSESLKQLELCPPLAAAYQHQENAFARNRFKLHLILPALDAIAHHPVVVSAVQQALQTEDILLWSSDINIKPANSHGFFAPHQDSTYAGLSPPSKCLTAWVALSDPVGKDEGCLSFFPQSHAAGQIPHVVEDEIARTKSHNMLSLGQYISEGELRKLDVQTPLAVPLRAGQMTLHSFYCVHFSGPNHSPLAKPRVGFALRYIDANCVVQTKQQSKEMVTLISSSSHHSTSLSHRIQAHFDLEPRLPLHPSDEDIQRGRHIREESMLREEANYFDNAVSARKV